MRRRLAAALARRPRAGLLALAGPGVAWLLLFFLAPMAVIAAFSLMPRGGYGGVVAGFTLEHFGRVLDPLYLKVAWRTTRYALFTTGLCLAAGFPVAWVIARATRWKHVLLVLVVVPLWTSLLVRTYAMIVLLRDEGAINTVLRALGIIAAPLPLLYSPGAVIAGLILGHLPLLVLPVYASLEQLDPALLEAAETLGARGWARFTRVTVPLAMPGVVAGCLLVFIPALGAFLVPDLLGGGKDMLLGTLIQNQFGGARDWPFGAALSVAIMAAVLVAVVTGLRRQAAAGAS